MLRVETTLQAEGFAERRGDIIWRIPLVGGGSCVLYLFLEFQS